MKNVVSEILKVEGGEDDNNGEYVQVMRVEGGQEDKDTRDANSSSSIADEDFEIVDIPESEFMSRYNDNAHDTMQVFF